MADLRLLAKLKHLNSAILVQEARVKEIFILAFSWRLAK